MGQAIERSLPPSQYTNNQANQKARVSNANGYYKTYDEHLDRQQLMIIGAMFLTAVNEVKQISKRRRLHSETQKKKRQANLQAKEREASYQYAKKECAEDLKDYEENIKRLREETIHAFDRYLEASCKELIKLTENFNKDIEEKRNYDPDRLYREVEKGLESVGRRATLIRHTREELKKVLNKNRETYGYLNPEYISDLEHHSPEWLDEAWRRNEIRVDLTREEFRIRLKCIEECRGTDRDWKDQFDQTISKKNRNDEGQHPQPKLNEPKVIMAPEGRSMKMVSQNADEQTSTASRQEITESVQSTPKPPKPYKVVSIHNVGMAMACIIAAPTTIVLAKNLRDFVNKWTKPGKMVRLPKLWELFTD